MKKVINTSVGIGLLISLLTLTVGVYPYPSIAMATTHTGAQFKVGIIDTGIDFNHPYLTANVDDSCSKNFITNIDGRAAADDTDGHGTRVAGLIGAEYNPDNEMVGMNPKARLCSLKVFETTPDVHLPIISDDERRVVAAIEYAEEKGIRLINMSWGSYVSSEKIKRAIAKHPHILFVAEAGKFNESQFGVLPLAHNGMNTFNNNDLKPFYPASYSYKNIISVTGVDKKNILFGNYGTLSVDLAALGLGVPSTDGTNGSGSYGSFGGAYLAAAQVTGAASYYWGLHPKESNLSVKRKLLASVDRTRFLLGTVASSGVLSLDNLLSGKYTSVIVE